MGASEINQPSPTNRSAQATHMQEVAKSQVQEVATKATKDTLSAAPALDKKQVSVGDPARSENRDVNAVARNLLGPV